METNNKVHNNNCFVCDAKWTLYLVIMSMCVRAKMPVTLKNSGLEGVGDEGSRAGRFHRRWEGNLFWRTLFLDRQTANVIALDRFLQTLPCRDWSESASLLRPFLPAVFFLRHLPRAVVALWDFFASPPQRALCLPLLGLQVDRWKRPGRQEENHECHFPDLVYLEEFRRSF